jgi:hypothetical protein
MKIKYIEANTKEHNRVLFEAAQSVALGNSLDFPKFKAICAKTSNRNNDCIYLLEVTYKGQRLFINEEAWQEAIQEALLGIGTICVHSDTLDKIFSLLKEAKIEQFEIDKLHCDIYQGYALAEELKTL